MTSIFAKISSKKDDRFTLYNAAGYKPGTRVFRHANGQVDVDPTDPNGELIGTVESSDSEFAIVRRCSP